MKCARLYSGFVFAHNKLSEYECFGFDIIANTEDDIANIFKMKLSSQGLEVDGIKLTSRKIVLDIRK